MKDLWKSEINPYCSLDLNLVQKKHQILNQLAIKAINAIAGNWCGYTVKSDKKRIGPKGQQVWQYSYQINHRPYNGTGFGDKGAPELPPYRPKTDNDIQELFDSIG